LLSGGRDPLFLVFNRGAVRLKEAQASPEVRFRAPWLQV